MLPHCYYGLLNIIDSHIIDKLNEALFHFRYDWILRNRILDVWVAYIDTTAAFIKTVLAWSINIVQKERKWDCYCATVFNKFKNYYLDKF